MSSTYADDALGRWRERMKSQAARPTNRTHERRLTRESTERPRTIAETAAELGLSAHTIRTWVTARRLAHIRLGRAIRIPAAEIKRVIDKNTVPAMED